MVFAKTSSVANPIVHMSYFHNRSTRLSRYDSTSWTEFTAMKVGDVTLIEIFQAAP